ncbi:hypothetical protein ACVISU_004989 [Bradyrhizobium sp. USDA 4452]
MLPEAQQDAWLNSDASSQLHGFDLVGDSNRVSYVSALIVAVFLDGDSHPSVQ